MEDITCQLRVITFLPYNKFGWCFIDSKLFLIFLVLFYMFTNEEVILKRLKDLIFHSCKKKKLDFIETQVLDS